MAGTSPKIIQEIQRDIGARGVRLRSTEWSLSDGEQQESLLIIPGVLCPRQSFEPLAQMLAREFRVITFDFPGFGESEKPSPSRFNYDITTFSDSVIDLLSGLNLARTHMIGHGVGGAVAMHVAARSAENVRNLALIAPLAYPNPVAKRHQRLVHPLFGGIFFRQFLGERLYSSLFKEYICATTPSLIISEYYQALSSPAARGDKAFTVEAARNIRREMPHAGIEILPTGHAPHQQDPQATANILIPFFQGKRMGSQPGS